MLFTPGISLNLRENYKCFLNHEYQIITKYTKFSNVAPDFHANIDGNGCCLCQSIERIEES